MTDRLTLTVAETAEILGVSLWLTYELVKTGQLPHIKLGRRRIVIPRAALERFLETECGTAA